MNPQLAFQLGSQIIGTGLSFAQAAEEKREMLKAKKAIDKYMAEARRKTDVNEFDEIDINKEIYRQQRLQAQQQAAQMTQAGVEGDPRGGAAMAGRALMGLNQASQGIAAAENQDMINAYLLSAKQAERNRRMSMGLDLAEVQGAQTAAALAETRRNQAMTNGMGGLQNTIKLGYESSALYPMGNPNKGGQVGGQVGGQAARAGGQADWQAANPFSQNPFNPYSIPQGSPDLYTPQTMGFVDPNYSFGGVVPFNFNPYSTPQGSPNLYTPQTMGFVDPNYSFGGVTPSGK